MSNKVCVARHVYFNEEDFGQINEDTRTILLNSDFSVPAAKVDEKFDETDDEFFDIDTDGKVSE